MTNAMTDRNDIHTAYAIRRQLDQAALALPDRVASRLARARQAALSAHSDPESRQSAPARLRARPARLPAIRQSRASRHVSGAPSRWSRLALTAVPAMAVVFGLVVIGQWSDQRRIEALAEIDAEVLVDDLPIAAYADRGFGVYLSNTRGWSPIPASEVAQGPDR